MALINGQKLALTQEKQLKLRLNRLSQVKKRKPLLVSLVAQEDKSGLLYTRLKQQAASRIGIKFQKVTFSLKQKQKTYPLLKKIITQKNLTGLIIQKPNQSLARKYFKSTQEFKTWWLTATAQIPSQKDVDCLNPANIGLLVAGWAKFYPATVKAVYDILLTIYQQKELVGKNIIILGSSEILGKPLAMLLRDQQATVTICGSSCRNLTKLMRNGDIIISGVGKPKLITGSMIKKGAVVIDAGITKINHKVVGDVDFKTVTPKAAHLTPVPGGVGPLTVICLMANVIKAFEQERK
jgi:methylenetetrahydrofolate dehydrogenase (NADP+)/methenyltetrahydrofolate cyclohydrolase